MTKEIPAWAAIGADLIEVRGHISGTTYGGKSKITARLGNGNVRVEGSTSQFAPNDYNKTLYERGDRGRWSRGGYALVTPELLAEIEQDQRLRAAIRTVRAEGERLEKLARSHDDEAIIAAAKAIAP